MAPPQMNSDSSASFAAALAETAATMTSFKARIMPTLAMATAVALAGVVDNMFSTIAKAYPADFPSWAVSLIQVRLPPSTSRGCYQRPHSCRFGLTRSPFAGDRGDHMPRHAVAHAHLEVREEASAVGAPHRGDSGAASQRLTLYAHDARRARRAETHMRMPPATLY